jgi:HPt (histidine-containing phosphotransfer) domain-containing protein
MSVVAGDRELLREVVEAFLEEVPGLLDQAKAAMTAVDAVQLRRSGHTIKGVMRTLGLQASAELAAELEDMGRSGDLSGASAVLARLESRLDEIVPEAKAFASTDRTR